MDVMTWNGARPWSADCFDRVPSTRPRAIYVESTSEEAGRVWETHVQI